MRIYLLSIDRHRFFFYADESEPPDEPAEEGTLSAAPPSTWRSRLGDLWDRFRSSWRHSEARAARWSRAAWDWLHSWAHPDELMLARLRRARRIELHYPATRDADEVERLWCDYLNHRWWRHVLWMTANGLVAPPALLTLWILPGPNLIGYWFAYRAIHHALIVGGIRMLRRGRVPVKLIPSPVLDRPIERDETGKARHEALPDEAPHLDEHVAWTEGEELKTADHETPEL